MMFHFYFKFCFIQQAAHVIDQHAKGQNEKIEVPTDTQPQFELGDTAEDIERRRREGEERERGGNRIERGWKRARKGQKSDHKQTRI